MERTTRRRHAPTVSVEPVTCQYDGSYYELRHRDGRVLRFGGRHDAVERVVAEARGLPIAVYARGGPPPMPFK